MSGKAGAVAATFVLVNGAIEELAAMRRELETEFPGETDLFHDIVHLQSQAHHLLRSLAQPMMSH